MKGLTADELSTLIRVSMSMVRSSEGAIRRGQAYMNVLYEIRPDLYEEITINQPQVDCFYNDDKIDNFMNFLKDLDD